VVIINIVYNIKEEYKNNVTDESLKEIINKKLLKIILFMENRRNVTN